MNFIGLTNKYRTMRFLFFFLALLIAGNASAQALIPELASPVIDMTGTLSEEKIQELSIQAYDLQQNKGSQLQILIVPTTHPEDIAKYAQRVFDQWKLGRAKADDGVLLIVAKDDRTVRIHTGYGAEGIIPDIVAGRIINEDIIPKFKAEDYSGGIADGARKLKALMGDENLPPPEGAEPPSLLEKIFTFLIMVLLLIFWLLKKAIAFFFTRSGSRRSSGIGRWLGGGRSWSGGGGRSGGGGASGSW